MSAKYTAANNISVNELIPLFTKYIVLDVITDPFHIARDFLQDKTFLNSKEVQLKDGTKKTVNAAEARILYWENNFGLTIDEKFRNRVLPRNTIIGRPYDYRSESAEAGKGSFLLFPFFPSYFSQPIKPGESVWVLHESNRTEHMVKGWWISKFVEFGEADDANFSLLTRGLESNSADSLSFTSGVKNEDGTTDTSRCPVQTGDEGPNFIEKTSTQTLSSKETIKEPIPRFKGRTSDFVFEGSNNTLIVLGTDRNSSAIDLLKADEYILSALEKKENHNSDSLIPEEDLKENAGSIDIVAGRGQTEKTRGKILPVESGALLDPVTQKPVQIGTEIKKTPDESQENEGDPDYITDKSRILISQRAKIDQKLKISEINQNFQITDSNEGDGSVMTKSDKIRIIARKDAQILVKDDEGNDITTIVAKNDGAITIKSKENVTLQIDPNGKVTLESKKGDIIVNPGEGMIRLGGAGANKAILCQYAGSPIVGSMGTSFGSGGTFGLFSRKVRVL
jgi:hypothetical protein